MSVLQWESLHTPRLSNTVKWYTLEPVTLVSHARIFKKVYVCHKVFQLIKNPVKPYKQTE